jgi:hypothetical protein
MMAAWRGCTAEPSTARLAPTKAAEEAMDLGLGVGGMSAPEKRLPFTELREMVGAALDRPRRSLDRAGRRGARKRTGHGRGEWLLGRW